MSDVVGLGARAAQVAPPDGDSRPVGIFGFLLSGPFRGRGDRNPRMCPRVVLCCRSRQAARLVGEARVGESHPGRNHLAEGSGETNLGPDVKACRIIGTRREPWEGGRLFGVAVGGRHPWPGKPGSLHGRVRWKRSWLSLREGSHGVRNEGVGDGVSEARPESVWRQGG